MQLEGVEDVDDLGSDGQLWRYELSNGHQLQEPDGGVQVSRVGSERAGHVAGPVAFDVPLSKNPHD